MDDSRAADPRSVLAFEQLTDELREQSRRIERHNMELACDLEQAREDLAQAQSDTSESAGVEDLRDRLGDTQARLDDERRRHAATEHRLSNRVYVCEELLAQRDRLWKEIAAGQPGYAANLLRGLMSSLCEQNLHAGWLDGMEFTLWEASLGGEEANHGPWTLSAAEAVLLQRLARDAGGWWVWPDAELTDEVQTTPDGVSAVRWRRPKFVPLEQWKQLHADHGAAAK